MRKLSDEQVEAFDREYVDAARLARVFDCIDSDFPDGRFRFLDVGGGNGRFADQLLARYPLAHGTVVDNSEVLLNRNGRNPRKSLRVGSAADIGVTDEKFDLISVHWLLHHLVGESYAESRAHQRETLQTIGRMLTSRGRISMFENDYVGWLPDPYPTYVIYAMTASRMLSPVSRALGANTAGVGVCFNSSMGWNRMLQQAGLLLVSREEPDAWQRKLPWIVKLALGLRDIRVGHYWLASSPPGR